MTYTIGILGLGAMGSMYAADFIDAGEDVRIIARDQRADRIQRDGFVLNDKAYHPTVTRPTDDAQPLDLILIGVKQHHLAAVLDDLAPFIGPETQLVSLLNGLDSEEMLIDRFGESHVIYCTTVGMTPLRDGNRVRAMNKGKLVIGAAENDPPPDRVLRVKAVLERSGITTDTPPDMMRAMWWKLMVNVAINQTTASTRMTFGEARESDAARALMDGLGGEVIAVAQAAGINLVPADLLDFYAILDTLDPIGKTSMYQDVEAGRTNEVDIFAGAVVRFGQKYGVPTPYNTTLLHILRGLQGRNV